MRRADEFVSGEMRDALVSVGVSRFHCLFTAFVSVLDKFFRLCKLERRCTSNIAYRGVEQLGSSLGS